MVEMVVAVGVCCVVLVFEGVVVCDGGCGYSSKSGIEPK